MADFLYNAGPPPPRQQYGRIAQPQPPLPPTSGLRYTPPSQARAPPSPNHFQLPPLPHRQYNEQSPPSHYTHQRPFIPPSSSSPHFSPEPGFEPQTIKCSSCGDEVSLDELGEHVCRPQQSQYQQQSLQGREDRRFQNDLRVDVQAAAPGRGLQQPGGYGGGLPIRSPMFAGHLEATPPHTPGSGSGSSRPTSPAGELSRSVGSTTSASSASSSRLPFFERYQKQYGGPGGENMAGVGAGLPRSATMDSISQSGVSPRLSPANSPYTPHRSPTAPLPSLPTSASAPNLNLPTQRIDSPSRSPQMRPGQRLSLSNLRQDSRDHVPTSSSFGSPQRHSPADFYDASANAPRPRKISLNEGGPRPSNPPQLPPPVPGVLGARPTRPPSQGSSLSSYNDYDRRETIKPSQSTPSDLNQVGPNQRPQTQDSISDELDGYLNHLRFGSEESHEGNGAQGFLDEQYASRRYSRGEGKREDPMTTPKASSSSRMPTSRSTPALATGVPAQAGIPPSGSVPDFSLASSSSAARGGTASSSSTTPTAASSSSSVPKPSSRTHSCTTCQRSLLSRSEIQCSGDGQPFCRPCFADRFLPKCRKCQRAIEGGAVTSSDGKVVGKYHRECFACFDCGEKFANGEFYVFDGKPYCQLHYHSLNGSLCANHECGKPIEGPCVSLVGEENGGGGRYHPPCFLCCESSCRIPLLEHHFVVDRLPYCELHSAGPVRRRQQKPGKDSAQMAKKRMTIITKR